jgi:hypothetical protein
VLLLIDLEVWEWSGVGVSPQPRQQQLPCSCWGSEYIQGSGSDLNRIHETCAHVSSVIRNGHSLTLHPLHRQPRSSDPTPGNPTPLSPPLESSHSATLPNAQRNGHYQTTATRNSTMSAASSAQPSRAASPTPGREFSTESYFNTQRPPARLEVQTEAMREFVKKWDGTRKVVLVTVSGTRWGGAAGQVWTSWRARRGECGAASSVGASGERCEGARVGCGNGTSSLEGRLGSIGSERRSSVCGSVLERESSCGRGCHPRSTRYCARARCHPCTNRSPAARPSPSSPTPFASWTTLAPVRLSLLHPLL